MALLALGCNALLCERRTQKRESDDQLARGEEHISWRKYLHAQLRGQPKKFEDLLWRLRGEARWRRLSLHIAIIYGSWVQHFVGEITRWLSVDEPLHASASTCRTDSMHRAAIHRKSAFAHKANQRLIVRARQFNCQTRSRRNRTNNGDARDQRFLHDFKARAPAH